MRAHTDRFAFFLVIIMGTLWTSQATTTTFGSNAMLQRKMAIRNAVSRPGLSKMRSEIFLGVREPSELVRLRGGEISIADDDEEEEGSLVAKKLRNVIRSILQISDDKLPLVSGFLRTFFKTIESVIGVELLPQAEQPSKKKGSKAKNKSKKKKRNSSSEDDKAEAGETTTKKPSKTKASASKKASASTKNHLSTTIKSSNPNYRIQKELKAFLKSPPDNLSVQVGSNIRIWVVTINAAKDTIYEGEVFKLRIQFPKEYPTVPPSVYFLKKHMPVHEHVYTNGDICLSLLGNGWRPTMSAQSIAMSILSILSSAQSKNLPPDNANQALAKPGQYQKDWVYHDDSC